MLKKHEIEFAYREYRNDPLTVDEIERVLGLLGASARDVLRTRDRVAVELGLSGDEPNDRLLELMADHPTLLQRPIGVLGDRAVVGRPPERLLDLT